MFDNYVQYYPNFTHDSHSDYFLPCPIWCHIVSMQCMQLSNKVIFLFLYPVFSCGPHFRRRLFSMILSISWNVRNYPHTKGLLTPDNWIFVIGYFIRIPVEFWIKTVSQINAILKTTLSFVLVELRVEVAPPRWQIFLLVYTLVVRSRTVRSMLILIR